MNDAPIAGLMALMSKELASQAEAVDRLCELFDPNAPVALGAVELSRRMQRMDYVHQVLLDISHLLAKVGGSLTLAPGHDLEQSCGQIRLADLRTRLSGQDAPDAASADRGDCDFF